MRHQKIGPCPRMFGFAARCSITSSSGVACSKDVAASPAFLLLLRAAETLRRHTQQKRVRSLFLVSVFWDVRLLSVFWVCTSRLRLQVTLILHISQVIQYIAPAPAVSYAAPVSRVEFIAPAASCCTPAPVSEYIALVFAVDAVLATVGESFLPAPIGNPALEPLDECIAPVG